MDPDDLAYKRSVRNMSIVLAAILLVIFGSLLASWAFRGQPQSLPSSGSMDSGLGFTLYLSLNSSDVPMGGAISATASVNNTASAILNVTAAGRWAEDPVSLAGGCPTPFPVRIGLMRGGYSPGNFSDGSPILPEPIFCHRSPAPPSYYLIQGHTWSAISSSSDGLEHLSLRTTRTVTLRVPIHPGLYTFVAEDEWGDVATAYVTVK